MSPFFIRKTKIRELPLDNDNFTGISSDWAYDHNANTTTAHGLTGKVSGSGIAKITVNASAPANPSPGDLWVDTDEIPANSAEPALGNPSISGQVLASTTGGARSWFSFVEDSPVDGHSTVSISSNWAYDHAASTTVHGISSYGSTLVDDSDAETARSTLGLGTAATHASSDFETADTSILKTANVSSTPTSGATTTPISSDAAFALLMKLNLLLGGI